MTIIATYKGTRIKGNTVCEVILEIKRLMDKEKHVNHVISR